MMPYLIIIEPAAELDLDAAFEWYQNQRLGLGRTFLRQVDESFERIGRTPELYAMVAPNTRLTLVRRFPYVICYLFKDATVFVVAVFHGHRDPNVWQSRLADR